MSIRRRLSIELPAPGTELLELQDGENGFKATFAG
jgi:hypothetical protein